MLTVLALTLVAQSDLDRARSLAFTEVEISWLASTGTVRSFDSVLPWRNAELLRQLDCPSYGCRRLAQDELARMGDDAAETLIWGLHDRGRPEVVATCERLLSRLYVCRSCGGSGRCSACQGNEDRYDVYCPNQCDYNRRCVVCGGAIDLRWERMPYDGFRPRNLFRRAVDHAR